MSDNKPDGWSIVSTIATVLLFGLNFFLYLQISKQTDSIKQSADAAIEANKEAKKNYDLSKEQFDSSNSANKKTLELQGLSIAAQIDALKEGRKEFEAANISNLEVHDVKVFFNDYKQDVYVYPRVINYSNQPVKEIMYRCMFALDPKINLDDAMRFMKFRTGKNYTLINAILNKDEPRFLGFVKPLHLPPDEYYKVRIGMDSLFIHVDVYYRNLITKQTWLYEFLDAVHQVDTIPLVTTIYNENTVVKKLPKGR